MRKFYIYFIAAVMIFLSACANTDNYDGADNHDGIVSDKSGDRITFKNEDQVTFITVSPSELSDSFGVAMEVKDVTPTGIVLTFTQTEPPPDGFYTSAETEFVIERYENGAWMELPQNDIGFIQLPIHISMAENGSCEKPVYWSDIYGILPEGSYRIGKEITLQKVENGVTVQSESAMCYADFEIPAAPPEAPAEKNTSYSARHYIRTNGYIDGEEYPKTFWITSEAELNEYYENNKDKYDLERKEIIFYDTTIGFLDATENYNDDFFAEHNLVIALLEEPSGSIRHNASLLFSRADLSEAEYLVSPLITRMIPWAGTADMAEWHMIFEVDKKFSPENCKLLDVSFSVENINTLGIIPSASNE